MTSGDVINLKLHTHNDRLTIYMCVNFEVTTKNLTTHIVKKFILMSFQPVARGRCCTLSLLFCLNCPPFSGTNIFESNFIPFAPFESEGTSGFDRK